MGGIWSILNSKKQKGQADKVKKFKRVIKDLTCCKVKIPINVNEKHVTEMIGMTASKQPRRIAMYYDGFEKKFFDCLVTQRNDMEAFKKDFAIAYPDAVFEDMETHVPYWFDMDTEYRVMDVGTKHGHYVVMLDVRKSPQLATKIVHAMQRFDYAWVQFDFVICDFTSPLKKHMNGLEIKNKRIMNRKYVPLLDRILDSISSSPSNLQSDPEKGRDFTINYKNLYENTKEKSVGPHVMLVIRGLFKGDAEMDLPFESIQNMPVEGEGSVDEHLEPYWYDSSRMMPPKKEPEDESTGQEGLLQRIGSLLRRLFPDKSKPVMIKIPGSKEQIPWIYTFLYYFVIDPLPLLNAARKRYFTKYPIIGYRDRPPLPFLILTLKELVIFLSAPDPSTPHVETTRNVTMPGRPSDKDGAGLGSFDTMNEPEYSDTIQEDQGDGREQE